MIKREYEKPNNQIYESRKQKMLDDLSKQYHRLESPVEKASVRRRMKLVERVYDYLEERGCR